MKCCRECGGEMTAVRKGANFCCEEHKKAWNNRRMKRGAELYDFVMAHNYERGLRKPLELQSLISRLVQAYHTSDVAHRDGRKSWNVQEAFERLPMAFGNDGDGR